MPYYVETEASNAHITGDATTVSISSYFMARFYDATMQQMEAATLAAWRAELLGRISGDVIEIGSGTGANLAYYSDRVASLTLTEPDRHMCTMLGNRLRAAPDCWHTLVQAAAADLPFGDNRFDAAVITLVLCSVDDQRRTLAEIRRVLKPGGRIYFIEHVLARQEPRLIKWQRLLQPVWVCACGNCHLTRDTERSLVEAGFDFESITRQTAAGCPAVVAHCIRGVAVAAA
ncbi:MAG: methyltransferase domain-containing protein [Pseudomonadota bacterium]